MPRKPIGFSLDFMIKDIFPRFVVKQFDDVSFNIKPMNQGLDYNVTNMTAKIFVGVNNDMFMQTTGITVSTNNINVLLDKNMLQKQGRAYAEIELTDSAGTITSSSFIFDIDPKIGEGGQIPGEYEGFVAKYERLIAEFRSQVNATINNCNNSVDGKLKSIDGLVNAKITDFETRGNAKLTDVENRFNRLTVSQQQSSEVIDARNSTTGVVHTSLKNRLDNISNEMTMQKVNLKYSTDVGYVFCSDTKEGQVDNLSLQGKTLVVDANNNIVAAGAVGATLKSVGTGSDKIEVLSSNNRLEHTIQINLDRIDYTLNSPIFGNESVTNLTDKKLTLLVKNKVTGAWVKDVKLNVGGSYTELSLDSVIFRISLLASDGWEIKFITKTLSDLITTSTNKSDKKAILYYDSTNKILPVTALRQWDSIYEQGEKSYYNVGSGKIVLDNTINTWLWNGLPNSNNTIGFVIDFPLIKPKTLINDGVQTLICDMFKWGEMKDSNIDSEIFITNTEKRIYVRILKNKLGVLDTDTDSIKIQKFKTWIQANPVTVVYQLATPQVYECVNLDLGSYSNETMVSVNSGAISPSVSFEITSHIGNTIQVLKERINTLEEKVTYIFKQLLAGGMQSLAYELYPEDFVTNEQATLEEPMID